MPPRAGTMDEGQWTRDGETNTEICSAEPVERLGLVVRPKFTTALAVDGLWKTSALFAFVKTAISSQGRLYRKIILVYVFFSLAMRDEDNAVSGGT